MWQPLLNLHSGSALAPYMPARAPLQTLYNQPLPTQPTTPAPTQGGVQQFPTPIPPVALPPSTIPPVNFNTSPFRMGGGALDAFSYANSPFYMMRDRLGLNRPQQF